MLLANIKLAAHVLGLSDYDYWNPQLHMLRYSSKTIVVESYLQNPVFGVDTEVGNGEKTCGNRGH